MYVAPRDIVKIEGKRESTGMEIPNKGLWAHVNCAVLSIMALAYIRTQLLSNIRRTFYFLIGKNVSTLGVLKCWSNHHRGLVCIVLYNLFSLLNLVRSVYTSVSDWSITEI